MSRFRKVLLWGALLSLLAPLLRNRANFDIPLNDPDGSAVFNDAGQRLPDTGKIFNTITDAREVQLALRLTF